MKRLIALVSMKFLQMRKLVSALIFISTSLFFSGSIFGNTHFSYMGADILYSHAVFKDGYGATIFSSDGATQLNFFIGYAFKGFIGFECGYEQNMHNIDTVTVAPMSNEFGVKNFTALVSNEYRAKSSMYGFNFNFVPQLRVSNAVAIVPVVGIAYIRSKDTLDLQLFDGDSATLLEQNNYNLSFEESKIIPRLGFRLQYTINRFLGVRASYIWEQTSLLQPKTTRNINPTQILQAKLSNTSSVGIGAFAYL
jgi:hypothetical protein